MNFHGRIFSGLQRKVTKIRQGEANSIVSAGRVVVFPQNRLVPPIMELYDRGFRLPWGWLLAKLANATRLFI
jgi:hypothetical protein